MAGKSAPITSRSNATELLARIQFADSTRVQRPQICHVGFFFAKQCPDESWNRKGTFEIAVSVSQPDAVAILRALPFATHPSCTSVFVDDRRNIRIKPKVSKSDNLDNTYEGVFWTKLPLFRSLTSDHQLSSVITGAHR